MEACTTCAAGEPDEIERMLTEVGVTGSALAAVHEILAPCEPDEPCIARIRDAIERAAESLLDDANNHPGGSVEGEQRYAATALLALLESLGDEPLDEIVANIALACEGRCHRRGPGGKSWQKTIRKLRDDLVSAGRSRQLVVEAVATNGRHGIRIGHTLADSEDAKSPGCLLVSVETLSTSHGLARRALRLCRLAIVKKIGRRAAPQRSAKNPLRITGLRLRGDTRSWSALHNAIADHQI